MPGKVTMIQKGGKTYCVFPDPANNRAYIGRPKDYRAYQQLRAEKKLTTENLETAQMYRDSGMEWSMGAGWDAGLGAWGPMGGPEAVLTQAGLGVICYSLKPGDWW